MPTRPQLLYGYAAVFGVLSRDKGGYVQTIQPGAFARCLRTRRKIDILLGHEEARYLGSRVLDQDGQARGELSLREDERGLWFELELPDSPLGREALFQVRRGVWKVSFGYWPPPGGYPRRNGFGRPVEELAEVDFFEISLLAEDEAAYPQTWVRARTMPYRRFQARRRANTCRATTGRTS